MRLTDTGEMRTFQLALKDKAGLSFLSSCVDKFAHCPLTVTDSS